MLDMNDELAKIENANVFRNMGEAASNSSSVIYIECGEGIHRLI